MRVIRNHSDAAAKLRERVRKHRRIKKFKEKYENAVSVEIQRRALENVEENFDHSDGDVPDCDSNNGNTNDFQENLKGWAVKHRITKIAINDLLSILIAAGFAYLPKDSRSLMKTPSNVEFHNLSKGQLWYRGITENLQRIFRNIKRGYSIKLDFNFDGVPLFNSSTKCFWPIIVAIKG